LAPLFSSGTIAGLGGGLPDRLSVAREAARLPAEWPEVAVVRPAAVWADYLAAALPGGRAPVDRRLPAVLREAGVSAAVAEVEVSVAVAEVEVSVAVAVSAEASVVAGAALVGDSMYILLDLSYKYYMLTIMIGRAYG